MLEMLSFCPWAQIRGRILRAIFRPLERARSASSSDVPSCAVLSCRVVSCQTTLSLSLSISLSLSLLFCLSLSLSLSLHRPRYEYGHWQGRGESQKRERAKGHTKKVALNHHFINPLLEMPEQMHSQGTRKWPEGEFWAISYWISY